SFVFGHSPPLLATGSLGGSAPSANRCRQTRVLREHKRLCPVSASFGSVPIHLTDLPMNTLSEPVAQEEMPHNRSIPFSGADYLLAQKTPPGPVCDRNAV